MFTLSPHNRMQLGGIHKVLRRGDDREPDAGR